MRISTAAGLVDVGLLMEVMKEKENKKGGNKNAKRKAPQESSTCNRNNRNN